jgi:hypothetical protein
MGGPAVTFAHIINQTLASSDLFEFTVAKDGRRLGTVIHDRVAKACWFEGSVGALLTPEQLVAVAKFMREKTDGTH